MKIKSMIVKAFAVYGLVRMAQDLTDFSVDDTVRGIEKRLAHHVVEVIFDGDKYSEVRVEFSSEKEAKEVLENLKDIQFARGFVTLEDLYEYVEPDRALRFKDSYYGWRNINDVKVVRVKKLILDKYALIFNDPIRVV